MFVLVAHDACHTACLVSDAAEPHFLGEVGDYKDAPGLAGSKEGPEGGDNWPRCVHPQVVLLVCGAVCAA